MQSVLVIIRNYWEADEVIGVAENLNAAKDFIFEYVSDKVKEDFKTDKEIEEFVKNYKLSYQDDVYNINFYTKNEKDEYDIWFEIKPFEVIK